VAQLPLPARPAATPAKVPLKTDASLHEAQTSELPPPSMGASGTRELPSECAAADGVCIPPREFAVAVCKHKYPNLPLYLFAGKQPWRHLYVKAESVEPVNAFGGEQSEAWMQFGEEVVLLGKRAPGGSKGVQVSGPSDVDVLRWDGTCATIREEMLVSYVTAPMQSPHIIWKYLDEGLQEALIKNGVVARAREGERKACRDSSVTHPTPACEKAMRQLTDAIVLAVHQNIELPGTGKLPEWASNR
jgi:hypothetical protein